MRAAFDVTVKPQAIDPTRGPELGSRVVTAMPGRFRAVGGTLLFLGAMASVASLFPPYYDSGPSLAAVSLASLVPSVFVLSGWFVAALLLIRPRTALAGLGVGLAVTLFDLPVLASPLVAVVHGTVTAGGGFELAADGWIMAALGTFYTLGSVIKLRCNGIGVERNSWFFLALAAVFGLIAAAGTALPDAGVTYYVAQPVAHTVRITCCGLTQHLTSAQLGSHVATIIYALAIPLLAACTQSSALRRGLYFGAGVFFAAQFSNAVLSSYEAVSSDRNLPSATIGLTGAALQPDLTVGCLLLGIASLCLLVMAFVRPPSAVRAVEAHRAARAGRPAKPAWTPVWTERHAITFDGSDFPLLRVKTPAGSNPGT